MEGKMRAQVYYEPEVMKLEMIDIPKIADNEVLVRVKATGICGSDISYYYGHSPLGTAKWWRWARCPLRSGCSSRETA